MSGHYVTKVERVCALCAAPRPRFLMPQQTSEFLQHLSGVHGVDATTLKRGAFMFVDGKGFSMQTCNWTRGSEEEVVVVETVTLSSEPPEAKTQAAAALVENVDTAAYKVWMNDGHDLAPVPQTKIGVIVHHLEDVCGSTFRRRALLKFLYGVESTKGLSAAQLNRLFEWLKPVKVGDDLSGQWVVRDQCYVTARAVLGEPPEQLGIVEEE